MVLGITPNRLYEPTSVLRSAGNLALGRGVAYGFRVAEADFSDAALVLLGHGSTVNADSSAPVYQLADEFRRRGGFAQVVEGFWKLEPGIAGALRGGKCGDGRGGLVGEGADKLD